MNVKNIIVSAIIFHVLGICAVRGEIQEWTNKEGKTIRAEFVSSTETSITLKLTNGKSSTIPLASLSEESREQAKASSGQAGNSPNGNFDAPWPKEAKAPDNYDVAAIQEGPDEYIYETPHFRFISNAKLGVSMIKKLSAMFESTYEANKALPINNLPHTVKDAKFPTRLLEFKRDYIAAGAREGTAGIFKTSEGPLGTVLVPFSSLGVKTLGSSYILDREKNSKTLRHEITHQMMPVKVKAAGWFSEGSAEYVALSPYRNGRINFNNKRDIAKYVTGYHDEIGGGRWLGKTIQAPSLQRYMTQSYKEFITKPGSTKNYGLAPLVVHFFYHGDGAGDAKRIKSYIKALQDGMPENKARDLLLDGRDWNQLADEISAYWRKSGVTILFEKSKT